MPLNFPSFGAELLSARNPYSGFACQILVPGRAVAIKFYSQRFHNPVVTNLDAWPNPEIGRRLFIRVATQGDGCSFGCRSCAAPELKGTTRNLTADEIVYQVLLVLASRFVNLGVVEELVIATMGLGEPFANQQVVPALEQLAKLFPEASFILSTTGPKTGRKVFTPALKLVRGGLNLDLQISVHSLSEKWRLDFIGDRLHNGWPIMSLTLQELAILVDEWFRETGRKVHINMAAGPDFQPWDSSDWLKFLWLFPANQVEVKLSLEGPRGNKHWDPAPYLEQLNSGKRALGFFGYQAYFYIPEGIEIGGSCGAQPGQPELVELK